MKTYEALSSRGEKVIVKIWKGEGKNDYQELARFLRGAVLAMEIQNSHVARVLEIGAVRKGFEAYSVLEYIEGEQLDRVLAKRKLTLEEKLSLFEGICKGILSFHKKGIIHRDIKPSNLLVSDLGIKIIDFGLVREVSDSELTRTGIGAGTLGYSSPEQLQGEKREINQRSDIFSIGVVLYEMLSGLGPYKEDLRLPHDDLEPRFLSEDGIPRYLQDLAYQLVRYLPVDRMGSLDDVLEVLESKDIQLRSQASSEEYENLRRSYSVLKKTRDMLEEDKRGLEKWIRELELVVSEKEKSKERAEEALRDFERIHKNLEEKEKGLREELERDKSAFEREKKGLKEELEKRERECQKSRRDLEEARETLGSLEGANRELTGVLKAAQEAKEDLGREFSNLGKRIEEAEKKASSAELLRLKRETEDLKRKADVKRATAQGSSTCLEMFGSGWRTTGMIIIMGHRVTVKPG